MKWKIIPFLLFLSTATVGQSRRRSEDDVLRSRRRMLMDPRRWREGERSLGDKSSNAVGTPPVRARDIFDLTSERGGGISDLGNLRSKEETEKQRALDNLFFTFCCGDNFTCLKAGMVCDGSRDCPDGEDEVQCETAEEEEKEKKKVTLVSIHTKVAKKAKARLELEEAKVVLIDGRKAKVKRRRRLRKVDKETESDDKGKENEITVAENEFERRDGLQTKVRKKPRTETEAKKQLTGDEIKIEESNLVEIEDGTKTTEIPVIPSDSLTTLSPKFTSEIEEAMKEGITEFPTATEHVGFERKDGGRVLLVGERKVRVKKRRRQKSPTPKSLLNLPSSSDSDASSGSAPVSSSSQLYSVEQLRQFLGQATDNRQTTDNRQAADKRNEGEDPPMILEKSPSIPAKSFQGTWIFNSFEKPNSRPTLPEPNLPNPPLPGPALPPGFFASFDAQFV